MKTSTLLHSLFIGTAATALLSSCGEDPGENVNQATTTDAVEKGDSSVPEGAVRYEFLDSSKITIVGSKKVGASHEGGFNEFSGFFTLKDGKPVGNDHQVVIQMDSLFSDAEKLTAHLKGDDFFAVSEFPTSKFDVTSLSPDGDSGYQISGNLTLRGTTKNITFPAQVSLNDGLAELNAEFKINRMDFGVSYQGAGDNLINEDVVIRFDLEAKAAE